MNSAQSKIIYGKAIRTSNQDMESIMNLWDEVLKDKPEGTLYAVYYGYESNHMGEYDFLIGSETPVKGVGQVTIESGSYHVVDVDTSAPDGIQQAWQKIWQSDIPRTYRTDYERYGEDGSIQIYLSV